MSINLPTGLQNGAAGRRIFGQFKDFLDDLEIASTVFGSNGTGTELTATTVSDAVGGEWDIQTRTTSLAATDYAAVQHVAPVFQLGLGVEVAFICRAKVNNAIASVINLGLAVQTSSQAFLGGSSTFAVDIVAFQSTDVTAAINFIYRKTAAALADYNSQSAIGPGGLVLDTSYHIYYFKIIMDGTTAGKGQVWAYIDGLPVTWSSGGRTLNITGATTATSLPNVAALALSAGIYAGADVVTFATGRKLTLDYIGAYQRLAS